MAVWSGWNEGGCWNAEASSVEVGGGRVWMMEAGLLAKGTERYWAEEVGGVGERTGMGEKMWVASAGMRKGEDWSVGNWAGTNGEGGDIGKLVGGAR